MRRRARRGYKGGAKQDGSRARLSTVRRQRAELRVAFAEAADTADGRPALLIGGEAAIVGVVAHIIDGAPGVILRLRSARRRAGDQRDHERDKGKSRRSHGNLPLAIRLLIIRLLTMRCERQRAVLAGCGDSSSAALSWAFCSSFKELAKPLSAVAMAST